MLLSNLMLVVVLLTATVIAMRTCANERLITISSLPTFVENQNDSVPIQPPCPQICRCTYDQQKSFSVDCSRLGLTDIPEPINIKVQSLNLSYNKLTKLPGQIARFQSLENLYLSQNYLTRVDVSLFTQLCKLRVLDLSTNHINSVKNLHLNQLFETLPKLETLDLSHNQLAKMFQNDSLMFQSGSLKTLSLENCSITDITNEKALKHMKKLNSLILAWNRFIWFTGFDSESIEMVDLSHCRLRHIKSTTFDVMPNLIKLILSDNQQFKFFSQYGPTSYSMRIMVLKQCYILPQELAGFPNLTYVSMRGNYIRELQQNSFEHNMYLQYLDLSRASIIHIHPNTFENMTDLQHLDLSENLLTSLEPNTFSSNKILTNLILSRNRFRSLEMLGSDSLKNVDISHCEITEISKSFLRALPAITVLSLAGNPLERIPDNFVSTSLITLDLSYCRLTEITEYTFTKLMKLSWLNLNGNRLSEGLKRAMFPVTVQAISLEDNPWRCDCSSHDFKVFYEYLKQVATKVLTENKLVCKQPKNYTGLTWYGACKNKWYLTYSPVSHLERTSMFLIYTLLTITVLSCIIFAARKSILSRQEHQREEAERLAAEQRLRLRLSRQRQRENAQLNAPDPRDLVSPPSYEEAVLMMRPSVSKNSDDECDDNGPKETVPLRSTSNSNQLSGESNGSTARTTGDIMQSDL